MNVFPEPAWIGPDASSGSGSLKGFDAVLMLSISDWPTEPRSNRYHYATRFARHRLVVFVQADQEQAGFRFEPSGHDGIELLHVSRRFGDEQTASLKAALKERAIVRPLVWVCFAAYGRAVRALAPAFAVFHATEDYFQSELNRQLQHSFPTFPEDLAAVLADVDLLVAVSEGVLHSYIRNGGYAGRALILENGCDYAFWQIDLMAPRQQKVALYQGGINYRLDAALIAGLARALPDWEFRFCGSHDPGWETWDRLLADAANVTDLGNMRPEAFVRESWQASVGIIPFVQTPFIVDVSFPLKAFEYVAAGLPVVTVPIRSLARWPELFAFAGDAATFAREVPRAAATVDDPVLVRARAATAAQRSYDVVFERLLAYIGGHMNRDGRELSAPVADEGRATFRSWLQRGLLRRTT